jgi:2-polyprenyl-3-methyl-5-hydroxy-6-metoxy-1,4-benzoquinol methylase
MSKLQARTIADFGEQWTEYPDSDGFFGSVELFNDIFRPLLSASDMAGKRVAEIGAGIGRFVNILAAAGAARVVALSRLRPFGSCRRPHVRTAIASPT